MRIYSKNNYCMNLPGNIRGNKPWDLDHLTGIEWSSAAHKPWLLPAGLSLQVKSLTPGRKNWLQSQVIAGCLGHDTTMTAPPGTFKDIWIHDQWHFTLNTNEALRSLNSAIIQWNNTVINVRWTLLPACHLKMYSSNLTANLLPLTYFYFSSSNWLVPTFTGNYSWYHLLED